MYNSPYGSVYGINPYQQQQMQNRLAQMEQQYNSYPQNAGYPQQTTNMTQMSAMPQLIKGRPVSSADEAKASMIDLDGTLFVFTDVANKCIYTKQIMLDGSAEFKTYVLEEQTQPVINTEQTQNNGKYVLQTDFEKILESIDKRFKSLEMEGEPDEPNASIVKSNVRK